MSNYVRNGRGSAWSGIPYNNWQRHNAQCLARGQRKRNSDERCEGSCCGSGHRAARRLCALLTSVKITGEPVILLDGREVWTEADADGLTIADIIGATFVCPLTNKRIPIIGAHVDRVIPGAMEGRYEPGNIALVSSAANLAKGDDAPNAYYARQVARHGIAFTTKASSLSRGARALVTTPSKKQIAALA